MDKTIYIYLSTLVVLYGLYRINSNEHFSDNTTIYIKSKYNIQEPDLDKIKQFDLAKEQIIKAQNLEMMIKNNQLKSQLDEAKEKENMLQLQLEQERIKQELEKQELIRQELEKQELEKQELVKQELVKQELVKQELVKLELEKQELEKEELAKQELVKQELVKLEKLAKQEKLEKLQKQEKLEKLSSDKSLTKIYYEKFNQIKEKIYEYMSPSITKYFNTAKTCGFVYLLYDDSSIPSVVTQKSNVYIPALSQGQMYLSKDKSQLILHYADKLGFTGINIPLNESSILITNGFSKYQIGLKEFNTNLDKTGYFSVMVNLSRIPEDFFNATTTYILCDCDSLPKDNIIIENQLWNSFLIFIGLIVLAILIINYKYVYEIIINFYFSNKSGNDGSKIDGGKHIFYVGGYDYRDYSD